MEVVDETDPAPVAMCVANEKRQHDAGPQCFWEGTFHDAYKTLDLWGGQASVLGRPMMRAGDEVDLTPVVMCAAKEKHRCDEGPQDF